MKMDVRDLDIFNLVVSPREALPVRLTCRGEGDYWLPKLFERVSSFFQPIPITFDILEKLTLFEKVTNKSMRIECGVNTVWIYKVANHYNLWLPASNKKISKLIYFHELQHAMRDTVYSNDVSWLSGPSVLLWRL